MTQENEDEVGMERVILHVAISKWILLLAYTRLGWSVLAHYFSKIVLGSTSAQFAQLESRLLGLARACS
jgi:hypothetical protein